jgi:ketosteroid isomerase-like protein
MGLLHRIVATFVFSFLAAVPALAQTSHKTNAEDAVRAADAAWLKAYEAKDVDKSVAFLDENASMLAPNTPIATGKTAISKLIAGELALQDSKIRWHPDKAGVAQSGELGYTSGFYDWSFKDKSGKIVSDTGKYLTVWKKQPDGKWKVLFDTYNSDNPPAFYP